MNRYFSKEDRCLFFLLSLILFCDLRSQVYDLTCDYLQVIFFLCGKEGAWLHPACRYPVVPTPRFWKCYSFFIELFQYLCQKSIEHRAMCQIYLNKTGENKLTINTWIDFWNHNSLPLIYNVYPYAKTMLSWYCSFEVSMGIEKNESSIFVPC